LRKEEKEEEKGTGYFLKEEKGTGYFLRIAECLELPVGLQTATSTT
jgi:hypothetical protein